ncbi:MAG: ATP-binding protein [Bacteroidia bacterium]|nr:ATP-binding protein [Bacteroidia bacterium]
MKERILYLDLVKHLVNKQVTVISGMRRVGKTTALKYLLEHIDSDNKIYLDLEKIENRFIFNQPTTKDVQISLQIEGIDFERKAFIAIDEIQLVPTITSTIKYLYDNYDIKFLVSGSSSFYLKNHFTESLAGRKTIFEMFPLTFNEFLNFKNVEVSSYPREKFDEFNMTFYNKYKNLYIEYLTFGGFPEVVTCSNEKDKLNYLKDIINSYIELDVKLLSDFSQSDNLYKLIRLLSSRAGNKVEYNKLSAILGLNRQKVKDYISLLKYTYFIKLIPPYSNNPDREIAMQKKLYFADNGLLRALSNNNTGALLENSIANQLSNHGEVQYYARKTGQEIDFILNKNIAIEVKETPVDSDFNTLERRAKSIGLKNYFLVGLHPATKKFVWAGSI